jgi:hypothetical protein
MSDIENKIEANDHTTLIFAAVTGKIDVNDFAPEAQKSEK